MKILIGFNGSDASRAGLGELSRMGLSGSEKVLVMAVAESWLPPTTRSDAELIAEGAVSAIKAAFPAMKVRSVVREGSPAHEIIAEADRFGADMIVVGEPTLNGPAASLFLGHTTQKILNETKCSVRIAREGAPDHHPARLLVAFDGSAGAISSVNVIAERNWPADTEVRLVAVADSSVLGSIGRFTPQMRDSAVEAKFAAQWVETLAASSLQRLHLANIRSSVDIRFGNAKDEIVREADEWQADTIFAGPHAASNSFERFLIGSVSSAVAARAHCSVEIVRR